MKKEACLLTIVAALLSCSTLRANAQDCGFFYPNGTNVDSSGSSFTTITSSILETAPASTNILTVTVNKTNSGSLTCNSQSDYLEYVVKDSTVEVNLLGGLDEDYDNGLLIENPTLTGSCTLLCTADGSQYRVLANQVQVVAVNDRAPEFNEPNLAVTIEETTSTGVDILSRSEKLLYARDDDYDESGKDASIVFSVDNTKFVVLPSFQITYSDGVNGLERTIYIPRVGLASSWSMQDGTSATFNLIAKDEGNPQNEKSIPITVNIEQVDLQDPKFLQDYYTAVVDSLQQAGDTLSVKPEAIKAVDEDFNEPIEYKIIDDDELELELVPNSDGGVEVRLKSPVTPSLKKMAYVIIEAAQKSNSERSDRVVLAVELPLPVETTTTSTTVVTTTITPETCPPCITSAPITCPICQTCPSCPTCTTCPSSPTECTTITQSSVQSTSVTPSVQPTESITTVIVTAETPVPSTQESCPPCPTCSPGTSVTTPYSSTVASSSDATQTSTVTTDCPVVTCPDVSSTTTARSDGTVPTDYPFVTCPDVSSTTTARSDGTVPTDYPFVTCPDVSSTTTARSDGTVPTDCPVVTCPTCGTCAPCPETPTPTSNASSCPPCEITPNPTFESTPSTTYAIDCTTEQPEATSSPATTSPKPTVSFEKDQYAAEVIENSGTGTPVVAVKAFSSDDQDSAIRYSLQPGNDTRYFTIDTNTGNITLAGNLQKGSYTLLVEAALPSSENGVTTVRVSAVPGAPIAGMHFGSPHYAFHIAERSPSNTLVGVIELRNPNSDIAPRIASVDPGSMSGYFDLESFKSDDTIIVNILINETFNRIYSGPRVVLDIAASTTRTVEVSTVVDIEIDDVNEPPTFSSSLLIIGYPERTFFDPAVSMPIFTFQASDPDEGDNAVLTYHLSEPSTDSYDIDANKGHLFVKGMDSLPSIDQNVTVTVKDLGGLSKSHQVKIRSLKDDEVHVITASGPETLTDEEIVNGLSYALRYDVVVLHKEKTKIAKGIIKRLKASDDFDYTIAVYAVQNGIFVGREQFQRDLEKVADEITGWTVQNTAVKGPGTYAPDTFTDDVTAYIVATAVLAAILGLILVSFAGYLFFLFRNDKAMPWSHLIKSSRKGSINMKETDSDLENTFSRTSDSSDSQIGFVAAGPRITQEFNKTSDALRTQSASDMNTNQESRGQSPFIQIEDVYCPDTPKPQKSILKTLGNEEDAYCPPTPTPKKSLLKDVQQKKESDKLPERVGVSFDPTPEVIKVASISALNEDIKADSSSDESEEGSVSVL